MKNHKHAGNVHLFIKKGSPLTSVTLPHSDASPLERAIRTVVPGIAKPIPSYIRQNTVTARIPSPPADAGPPPILLNALTLEQLKETFAEQPLPRFPTLDADFEHKQELAPEAPVRDPSDCVIAPVGAAVDSTPSVEDDEMAELERLTKPE